MRLLGMLPPTAEGATVELWDDIMNGFFAVASVD